MGVIKKSAKILVVVAILSGIWLFFASVKSYVDVFNACHITIEKNVLRGSKKTIKDAIRLLKREDDDGYRALCFYVDTISEKPCFSVDGHIDNSKFIEDFKKDGCYVRGSKIIYIQPESKDSAEIARKRMLIINKISRYSEKFWNGKGG